ncbi:MAG: hypothetical protein AB8C84_00320 [Oligoflexales bacterium]
MNASEENALTTQEGSSELSEVCKAWEKHSGQQSLWLDEAGVVLTRFLKQCETEQGESGYQRKSPFVLMGFPCTGGGKIEWKGSYYNPRMVSMGLSTSCRMNPSGYQQVASLVKDSLQLDQQAALLAYNPFALQYWEVEGSPDADVGYEIQLRSHQGLQFLWGAFQKGEDIPIKLYGRENAWVLGDQFFEVQASLKKSDHASFVLQVHQVSALNQEQISLVRTRCEALSPQRRCDHVFGNKLAY